jgi:hypothetical protein
MIRFFAILFGIATIFIGVAGFLPTFIQDGLLFGYFNTNSILNVIHISIGVIAIMAATSYRATKFYFQAVGLLSTALAVWGFWTSGDIYMMHLQPADNILHIVIGVVALLVGFNNSKEG